MRLVDADAIRYDQLLNTGNKEHPLEWAVSQSVINSMPTVSQHVESVGEDGSALKHGHWRYDEALELEWRSECGFGKRKGDKRWYSYCPNCGAKMDEVSK